MRRSKLSRLLLSLPLALIDLVLAQSPLTPVNLPSLDLSSFGQVSIGGSFDGVSLYQYTGQNPSTTVSSNGNGVYIQLPNGALALLGAAQGTISSLCTLDSGLFIGGNFSTIAGVNASNIASWNFTSSQFAKLNDRDILGSVTSLYCDKTQNLVYVGGNFQSGGSNNAIVWDANAGHWEDLPFGGFDGPVNSIQEGSNGTILFGGVFDALGNGTTGGLSDRQVINLVSANVTSNAGSTAAGFSDPSVLFCTNGTDGPGSTWLLEDQTPGDMTVLGNFGYRPTKLRIRNTHYSGRGTKTFRFVAQPIDGIMNFTYTDPTTGKTAACDATCPLSNDSSIEFQDFKFVNVIGMNGFRLFISDWYGEGGGLSGIELFEDDIVAYAVSSFNEPTCQVPTLGSTSSTTGPFIQKSSFPDTSASYLSSTSGGNVTMEPQVLISGNYSIRLFTPGCSPDATCSTRGIVRVQTYFNANDPPKEDLIYQTNLFDKYDTIFQGRVQASSTTFRPRVVISPAEGQPATQDIVAQKVQLLSLSANGDETSISGGVTSSGSLNGLFEYAAGNWSSTTNVANATFDSPFDVAGTQLGFDASITGVVNVGGRNFVAGEFSSTGLGLENVMVINSDGTAAMLPSGGLNGPVESMAYFNGTIYFGGQFTGTANSSTVSGLSNVAAYDTNNDVWMALGSGLNGNVTSVVLYAMPTGSKSNETVVAVSGQFTQILGSTAVDVPGLAIWIPSQGDWAERIGSGAPLIEGSLAAETASSNGTVFVAGEISAWQDTRAQGIIGLGNSALNAIPLGSETTTNSTRRKRSLNTLQNSTSSDIVITAGAYYTGNSKNITIVAGHFTLAEATNLAFIDGKNGNAVSGLPSGIDSNATYYALLVNNDRLYIGGEFTGTINTNVVEGLAFYDFTTSQFATTQPPSLTGDGIVLVNTLAARPNNPQIFVGGRFSSAGSLPCPSVCIYDTGNSQWLRPGSVSIDGEVSQIVFENENTALVVGNISIGGNNTFVGRYDFQASTWTSVDVGVTGPVESVLSQDGTTLFLVGTNSTGLYFGKWNGQQYQDLTSGLQSTSRITDIQFLPLSSDHASNNILSSDRVIMLMGDIQLPGFGNVSAVLYDGSSYQPYILSTQKDGTNGIIHGLFSQNTQNFSSQGHIAIGWIIVIALAISLFLILLLVIGGIIAARIRRRREGYIQAPGDVPAVREASLERVPPAELFGNMEGHRGGTYL